jgi:hypothetical protein
MKHQKAALFSLLITSLGCQAENPVGSSTTLPVAVQQPAAAVTQTPSTTAPAAPSDVAEGTTCKESFRMVPVNFQKRSGTLPEVLRVRFERLVPLSNEVHVATFDTTLEAAPGRQGGPLQARSARLGAERGSTVQLEIPIECGVALQVDFGCGADAPAGGGYDGGSYNSHVMGRRECTQAAPPAGTPGPAATPAPTPTPEPEPTTSPTGGAVSCPDIGLQAVDVGSGNGSLRLQVSTSRPSAQEIVVVATPEEGGAPLQTTVSREGGLAALTGPAPQRWYQITVSAFESDGDRCDLKLRICF